ncbi:MAG: hypothetical protein ACREP8_08355 [Candidatus Binatia bacterium]
MADLPNALSFVRFLLEEIARQHEERALAAAAGHELGQFAVPPV